MEAKSGQDKKTSRAEKSTQQNKWKRLSNQTAPSHARSSTTTIRSIISSGKPKSRSSRGRADTRVVIVDKDKQNYLPPKAETNIPYDNVGLHQPRRHYQHETAVVFESKPRRVLMVKKHKSEEITKQMQQMIKWLQSKHVEVFVEPSVHEEFDDLPAVSLDDPGEGIDFMICLGGDGTLLHLTSLFQSPKTMPPVMVFASGSLGFLTPYDFSHFPKYIGQVLKPNTPHFVTFRLRLEAKIYRFNASKSEKKVPGNIKKNSNSTSKSKVKKGRVDKDSPSLVGHNGLIEDFGVSGSSPASTDDDSDFGNEDRSLRFVRTVSISGLESDRKFEFVEMGTEHTVLNEVLITRGPYASMITVQLFVDGEQVTTVNADGLIIATPTGSTAYSVSAGGSLVSPLVPSICITPICPHTLSFRPVIVPDTSIIQVRVPNEARHLPIAQFDGAANAVQLQKGDVVEIVGSEFPLPTFKQHAFGAEWFSQLRSKFNWNIREEQKPL